MQFGTSVVDDGPGCPDPTRRYVLAWWKDGGLNLAVSPDGLDWTRFGPGVLLYQNHDITGLFYDPLRKRYAATASVYRTGDTWSGERRVTMLGYSTDLLSWSTPHYVLTPSDAIEGGGVQFYAMDGYLVRGDLVIGMVKVLRDDLKADNPPDPPDAYGVGYTTLAWSHDGNTWFRDREHFFDPDPRKGAWDHAHAWIDEQVLVDGEVYLYYGGYARGHKVNRFEERQIGLLKIPRDRYVAREARDQAGRIVTPLVILDAGALTLNADCHDGEIVVQVLDDAGKPVPGFTSSPVTADNLAAPVHFTRPISELKDKPVRIEFRLANARLFAFELANQAK